VTVDPEVSYAETAIAPMVTAAVATMASRMKDGQKWIMI
jgi:hypothetical protein